MSDVFWMTLAANLTALASLIAILFHRREANKAIAENTALTKDAKIVATEAKREAIETKEAVRNEISPAVEEVRQATNGMRDELVKVTAAAEFAKGIAVGKAQAIEEQKHG